MPYLFARRGEITTYGIEHGFGDLNTHGISLKVYPKLGWGLLSAVEKLNTAVSESLGKPTRSCSATISVP